MESGGHSLLHENCHHQIIYAKFNLTLRKKCPYSYLLWSVFSRVRTEYEEIFRICLYTVQMPENTDQNNFEYGHFSRSVIHLLMKGKSGIIKKQT